jgi:hypothetical protein
MSTLQDSMQILREELTAVLDNWRVLLMDFQAVNIEELEFELEFGGIRAERYMTLVEELELESATALEQVRTAKDVPNTMITSIAAMAHINRILDDALAERELLHAEVRESLQSMTEVTLRKDNN